MLTYNEYLDKVNQAILAIPYPEEPETLYEPIAYTMSLGGKRLRPILLLMACDAMGGNVGKALEPAVGIELFHNFTLLHDDVMDNADVRRGKPTVHRRWNNNIAILSGDTMLTMAGQYVSRGEPLAPIVEMFNKTAIDVYEGQQWDMDYEDRFDVDVSEYVSMIRLKTGALIGCACKMGATIAGAGKESCEALYDMGVNLGIAFQLRDDMLDVWGDEASFGKEIGGDIMNNKKTYLLVNAVLMAKGDDAVELRHWLNDEYAIKQEKVPAVRAIYEKLGLRKTTEDAIKLYSRKAIASLEKVQMDTESHDAFVELINSLIGRKA